MLEEQGAPASSNATGHRFQAAALNFVTSSKGMAMNAYQYVESRFERIGARVTIREREDPAEEPLAAHVPALNRTRQDLH
jgi:hypothetical protein